MDAFEAFGDDGFDAQHDGALGGPVTGGAGTVFLACEHDERHIMVDIVARRFEDRGRLLVEEVVGVATRVISSPTEASNWLRRRMLPNVPRTMTSWLPRREP